MVTPLTIAAHAPSARANDVRTMLQRVASQDNKTLDALPQRRERAQRVLIVLIDLVPDHPPPACFGLAARVRAPCGTPACFLGTLLLMSGCLGQTAFALA